MLTISNIFPAIGKVVITGLDGPLNHYLFQCYTYCKIYKVELGIYIFLTHTKKNSPSIQGVTSYQVLSCIPMSGTNCMQKKDIYHDKFEVGDASTNIFFARVVSYLLNKITKL